MNPPFSVGPNVGRARPDADLRHPRSAAAMLPPGGRLAAIASEGCRPGGRAWTRAFDSLDPPVHIVFSLAVAGRVHARRGTTATARLTVRVVAEGLLSDAQLESVVLAGQAHERHPPARYRLGADWEAVHRLPDDSADIETADAANDAGNDAALSEPVRFRQGWMLGDGTGCGKGRQVAGIVLDRWLRGNRKALWLSASDKLVEDARRDWTALGGRPDDVVPLARFRQGAEIPLGEGVLFATYATLRSPARQGRTSRLEQIVAWLAGSLEEDDRHEFDGVLVFDESHAMANAAGGSGSRGRTPPSRQGRAGPRPRNALPDARVVYVSATGATTVQNLAYATRLGLRGSGDTPFENRMDFISAMEAGGVAAMEAVARETRRRFATDLANLTLAARVVEVRRRWRLTIDRREAHALEAILPSRRPTDMVSMPPRRLRPAPRPPHPTPTPTPVALTC